MTNPTADPSPQAEYWQWRRKGEPWSLTNTFHSEVFATTDDSEVRALIALAPQAVSEPPAGAAVPDGFWLAPDDLDQSMMIAANRQYRDNTTCTARDFFQAIRADWISRNGRLATPTHQAAEPAASERQPLTFSQLNDIARQAQIDFVLDKASSFELAFARAIEAAHGIAAIPASPDQKEGEQP